MSVCVSLCAIAENPFPGGLGTSGQRELIANIGIPLDILRGLSFRGFLWFNVHNGGVSRERVCGCGCWRQ